MILVTKSSQPYVQGKHFRFCVQLINSFAQHLVRFLSLKETRYKTQTIGENESTEAKMFALHMGNLLCTLAFHLHVAP